MQQTLKVAALNKETIAQDLDAAPHSTTNKLSIPWGFGSELELVEGMRWGRAGGCESLVYAQKYKNSIQ